MNIFDIFEDNKKLKAKIAEKEKALTDKVAKEENKALIEETAAMATDIHSKQQLPVEKETPKENKTEQKPIGKMPEIQGKHGKITFNPNFFRSKEEARKRLNEWDITSIADYQFGMAAIENSNLPAVYKELDNDKKLDYTVADTGPDKNRFVSKTAPSYFRKWGYYLLYDKGVCYLLTKGMTYPIQLVVPQGYDKNEIPKANPFATVIYGSFGFKYRHLTQTEFDNVIKANLPLEELTSIYQQLQGQRANCGLGGPLKDGRAEPLDMNTNNTNVIF
jgi:hypothetical protein